MYMRQAGRKDEFFRTKAPAPRSAYGLHKAVSGGGMPRMKSFSYNSDNHTDTVATLDSYGPFKA